MPTTAPLWGFIGLFAGAWKLAIVAAVVVTLYGRALRPHAAATRVASALGIGPARVASPRRSRFNDRVFLFLMVVAASAVASLILGRSRIMQAMSGPERPPGATRPAPRAATSPLPADQ